jgi:predicted HicB family RNase H-like nuclease
MNEMNYKGYIGTAEISEADDCLHGKLAHISDLVTYQAATPKQLTAAFEEAVDDYLETCAELEKEPDKPFKGSFNVRTTPETHRKAANLADMTGVKLNKFCGDALYDQYRL